MTNVGIRAIPSPAAAGEVGAKEPLPGMEEIERIKAVLRENLPVLREKYKVRTIGVFGSYVRGEQKKRSDVDILVEFDEIITFFEFLALERQLSKLIGKKVDLVMKSALKPKIGEHILKEVVYV